MHRKPYNTENREPALPKLGTEKPCHRCKRTDANPPTPEIVYPVSPLGTGAAAGRRLTSEVKFLPNIGRLVNCFEVASPPTAAVVVFRDSLEESVGEFGLGQFAK